MEKRYSCLLIVILATAASLAAEPDSERIPKQTGRQNVITNSIGMKLVWILPGDFDMGSDLSPDDTPVHRIKISRGFWMGQTEVTQDQWTAIMGTNPSHFKGDYLLVERVSWKEAVKFCHRLSREEGKRYKLPTEAKWEYVRLSSANRTTTNTCLSFQKTTAYIPKLLILSLDHQML